MKRRNFLSAVATAGIATSVFPNTNFMKLNSSKFKDKVNKILAKIFFLNEKFKTFIKSEKTLPHKIFDVYEMGEKQIIKLIKKIKKPKN